VDNQDKYKVYQEILCSIDGLRTDLIPHRNVKDVKDCLDHLSQAQLRLVDLVCSQPITLTEGVSNGKS
jgi:hypothetical protein